MSTVIRAVHVTKEYRLGVINHGMLYKDFQSWMARRLGRADPHAPLGARHFADQEDRFWALKDVCFDIEQGDRVGIIGRNGAGKSTLLKILSRITAPTEGCVKIRGRVASLLEVGTGFHSELTGRENIYLNGAILGMKKREIDRKIDEIIAFSEIEQHIDTPVKRYSSGMYVRLAFAVAAHLDSEILIADEVLAVGDAAFQEKAIGKMNDLSSGQGRTVIFVSHNMESVKRLCERGFILDKGALAFRGSVADAIKRYINRRGGGASSFSVEIEGNEYGERVRLLRFGIVDKEGRTPAGSLLRSEEYRLYFDLEISEMIPNLSLFWSLFSEDNTLVFLSDIHDCGIEAKNRLGVPGRKHITCKLPTELLSEAKYSVEFSCVIHGTGWPLMPQVADRLFFDLKRDDSMNTMHYDAAHPYGGGDRPGLLSPVIEWKFE